MSPVGTMIRVAGAATLIALAPRVGMAQTGLSNGIVVTPYIGAYLPSSDVARVGATSGGSTVNGALKHEVAAAFGATASYWLNDRFGLEAGGAYATSGLKGTMSATEFGSASSTQTAHVWLGSARVMMQLLPATSGYNLRFGIGPAVISRGGTAYAGDASGTTTGTTDFGAAASLCTRIGLTDKIGLRLRAEDYIYSAKLGYKGATAADNYSFDSRTQNDFVISAGLQLFLNR